MIEIVSVLVALCLVSVVARMVARYRRRVGFGIDDYLSLVSMVLMIAMLIELVLCKSSHLVCVHVCVWFLADQIRVFDRRQWDPRQVVGQQDPCELLEGMQRYQYFLSILICRHSHTLDLPGQPVHILHALSLYQDLADLLLPPCFHNPQVSAIHLWSKLPYRRMGPRNLPRMRRSMHSSTRLLGPQCVREMLRCERLHHRQPSI